MKAPGFHNKLVARPVSDVAPAPGRLTPDAVASATPQWRGAGGLPPWAALTVILAAIAVALCEPWRAHWMAKSTTGRRDGSQRLLRHRQDGNRPMEGGVSFTVNFQKPEPAHPRPAARHPSRKKSDERSSARWQVGLWPGLSGFRASLPSPSLHRGSVVRVAVHRRCQTWLALSAPTMAVTLLQALAVDCLGPHAGYPAREAARPPSCSGWRA